MRYSQLISDLTDISFATIFHHAGAADDLQIGDFRQLGQNIVLDAIGKKRVFFFSRSGFQTAEQRFRSLRMLEQIRFSKHSSQRLLPERARHAASSALVGLRCTHFLPRREDSGAPRVNRLVLQPAFKIFGQRESGRITTLRIFLEALEADG